MKAILVPRKRDLVSGYLEVCLIDELLDESRTQDLGSDPRQGRVGTKRREFGLGATAPNHPVNPRWLVFLRILLQDKIGSIMILGRLEAVRGLLQSPKGLPKHDHLDGGQGLRHDQEALLEEKLDLAGSEGPRPYGRELEHYALSVKMGGESLLYEKEGSGAVFCSYKRQEDVAT
jgi:hypothetical protein